MASTTSFTIEGPMSLAYFSSERYSKLVLIKHKEDDVSPAGEPPITDSQSGSLGAKIADEIGFPNDAEFDELYRKFEELRKQGLRTEEGVPDVTRDVQLRITVEVL